MSYAYSTDGGESYQGDFPTAEEAATEGCELGGGTCYVGRSRPPEPAENLINWYTILDDIDCQEDYSLDCADCWCNATVDQAAEVEREIGAVVGAWLDRHNLRPRFFVVDDAERWMLRDGVPVRA